MLPAGELDTHPTVQGRCLGIHDLHRRPPEEGRESASFPRTRSPQTHNQGRLVLQPDVEVADCQRRGGMALLPHPRHPTSSLARSGEEPTTLAYPTPPRPWRLLRSPIWPLQNGHGWTRDPKQPINTNPHHRRPCQAASSGGNNGREGWRESPVTVRFQLSSHPCHSTHE